MQGLMERWALAADLVEAWPQFYTAADVADFRGLAC